MSKHTFRRRAVFRKAKGGKWSVRFKGYLKDQQGKVREGTPTTLIDDIYTQDGTKELAELFPEAKVFDFPKPAKLVQRLLSYRISSEVAGRDDDDIVLDFFAGSCATAQAVLQLNGEDGYARRFIMVQLPEPLEDTKRLKDGTTLRTIADIGRERISRVIKKIKGDKQTKLRGQEAQDLGFRSFRLAGSNCTTWRDTERKTVEKYVSELETSLDSLKSGWKPEDVICEVALREGLGLTSSIERLPQHQDIFKVTDPDKQQTFFIDLDDKVALSALKPLCLKKEDVFICRDSALDDTTAANLALQCRLKTI